MTSFSIQILGGSLIDEESFVITTGAVAGSFLILGSTSIHTIYKEPIIFLKSSTLYDLMNTLRNTPIVYGSVRELSNDYYIIH